MEFILNSIFSGHYLKRTLDSGQDQNVTFSHPDGDLVIDLYPTRQPAPITHSLPPANTLWSPLSKAWPVSAPRRTIISLTDPDCLLMSVDEQRQ